MSDLAELFSRDPLSYTKEGGELRTIIEEMRKKRGQFILGNSKAGSMKASKPSEKAAAAAAAIEGVNIGGLDL
jgi:hypothetical protein